MQGYDIPTRVQISQLEDNLRISQIENYDKIFKEFNLMDNEKDEIEPLFIDYSQL